jgi:hypothetical protein
VTRAGKIFRISLVRDALTWFIRFPAYIKQTTAFEGRWNGIYAPVHPSSGILKTSMWKA